MRIEARIKQKVPRERTHAPIRFLESLVDFYPKFIFQQTVKPGLFTPQDASGLHRVEDVGKRESIIAAKANDVIFRRVKNFLDARIGKDRPQRAEVIERERVKNVIRFRRGELNQAHALTIRMQTV